MPRGLQPLPGDTEPRIHIPTSGTFYEAALQGLVKLNEQIIESAEAVGRPLPRLYDAGVVYKRESRDTWRHALDLVLSGWGDCEDLAAFRVADLHTSGEDPDAHVYVYRSGPKSYHAVVGLGDGTIEDPSYLLGMRVPRGWRPLQFVGQTRYNPGKRTKNA